MQIINMYNLFPMLYFYNIRAHNFLKGHRGLSDKCSLDKTCKLIVIV